MCRTIMPDIRSLRPGPELDRRVASAMGWDGEEDVDPYSTVLRDDLLNAVRDLSEAAIRIEYGCDGAQVSFLRDTYDGWEQVDGDTLAHALCLAYLRAKEGDV